MPHDLFALTDEQILEIEPEAPDAASVRQPFLAVLPQTEETTHLNNSSDSSRGTTPESPTQAVQQSAQAGVPVPPEPPPWLAAQMKDPWSGEEAKEFWNGVQQAQQEAAAYRAAFATPEDARALKELYPGGVNEARAAASRARLLDEIDRAYFGLSGGSAEQTSAARADLAQRMLREDPAAFREMVFAGMRALEEAEKGSGTSTSGSNLPRLAQAFAANRPDARSGAGATLASPAADHGLNSKGGASPALTMANGPLAANAASGASSLVGAQLYPERSRGNAAPQLGNTSTEEAHVAGYAAFEKAANEDLERSVGAAITHTIQQALPNLAKDEGKTTAGARNIVPLQERLGAAVRQDVEAALKGDRQLGEQIAQILSARRFDNETRAQVVRLIDDRARQLVPSAARRVINDWTQATLAAHRGKASRGDAASIRRELEPVVVPGPPARQAGLSPVAASQAAQTRPGVDPHRNASRSDARRLDYRKLSDEQILDL
jgi:hypothetical protein